MLLAKKGSIASIVPLNLRSRRETTSQQKIPPTRLLDRLFSKESISKETIPSALLAGRLFEGAMVRQLAKLFQVEALSSMPHLCLCTTGTNSLAWCRVGKTKRMQWGPKTKLSLVGLGFFSWHIYCAEVCHLSVLLRHMSAGRKLSRCLVGY